MLVLNLPGRFMIDGIRYPEIIVELHLYSLWAVNHIVFQARYRAVTRKPPNVGIALTLIPTKLTTARTEDNFRQCSHLADHAVSATDTQHLSRDMAGSIIGSEKKHCVGHVSRSPEFFQRHGPGNGFELIGCK